MSRKLNVETSTNGIVVGSLVKRNPEMIRDVYGDDTENLENGEDVFTFEVLDIRGDLLFITTVGAPKGKEHFIDGEVMMGFLEEAILVR